MQKKSGIFRVLNRLTGDTYVESSADIEATWQQFRTGFNNPRKAIHKHGLSKIINQYGVENFRMEILEECPIGILNERKFYWLSLNRELKKEVVETKVEPINYEYIEDLEPIENIFDGMEDIGFENYEVISFDEGLEQNEEVVNIETEPQSLILKKTKICPQCGGKKSKDFLLCAKCATQNKSKE